MTADHPDRLLQACAQGDREAFRRLYDQCAPQLFAVAVRMMKDRPTAEDVIQDSFISVWRKADSYRPELGSAQAWLTVLVRNRCLDRLRARRPAVPVEDAMVQAIPDGAPDPFERTMASLEGKRIGDCIERLSGDQKTSILQVYYEGLTQEEVASRLTTPIGTVKSWIRRGLLHLKECLGT